MELETGVRSDCGDPNTERGPHPGPQSVMSTLQRTRTTGVSIPCPTVAVGDLQQTSLTPATSLASSSSVTYLSSMVTRP